MAHDTGAVSVAAIRFLLAFPAFVVRAGSELSWPIEAASAWNAED
jgi:hypothetical protein